MLLAGAARAETEAALNALNARMIELHNAGKSGEAIPLAQKFAAAIKAKHGEDAPEYATALNNLAGLLRVTNRLAEAEPLMRRALAIDEKSFGPEHPNVARDLNNLAGLLRVTNRLAEAEPLMRRALAIDEKSFGPEHPNVARGLNNLAVLRSELRDWRQAATLHRRAIPIMTASESGRADLGKANLAQNTYGLRAAARAIHRSDAANPTARIEAFALAQWATQTGAAEALAQMSLRFAKGGGALAGLVRERQDLSARREGEDKRLLAAGNAELAAQARDSLAKLDADLAARDARLAREFPEYATLAAPKPGYARSFALRSEDTPTETGHVRQDGQPALWLKSAPSSKPGQDGSSQCN